VIVPPPKPATLAGTEIWAVANGPVVAEIDARVGSGPRRNSPDCAPAPVGVTARVVIATASIARSAAMAEKTDLRFMWFPLVDGVEHRVSSNQFRLTCQ
jgi:hypothetical protein